MNLHSAIFAAVDEDGMILSTPEGEIVGATEDEVRAHLRAWSVRGSIRKVIMVPYDEFSDLVREVEEIQAA